MCWGLGMVLGGEGGRRAGALWALLLTPKGGMAHES